MYKELRNKLQAQGKRINAIGVKGIGQELSSKEFFMDSKLDGEELDEVHGMPWVHGTYYDPWEKQACADNKLLKVVVDPSRTQQECIEETEDQWNVRYDELAACGFYTTNVLENPHLIESDEVLDKSDEKEATDVGLNVIEEDDEEKEEEGDSLEESRGSVRGGAYFRAAEKKLGS